MDAPTIRSALPADETTWRSLWRGYCDFYDANLPQGVTDRTWNRILDPDSAVMCVVAEVDGQIYGFANCVVHENTWEIQPVCYLEDLFVLPAARGHGIGQALIEWLRNSMRAEGWARLYWTTREDNAKARALYDRFAKADGFVRYVINQKQAGGPSQ
ncbi:MAG: GNAT family N-acetyltransferase [Ramlibacter sp.]